MYDLIKDISVLTTIPESTLNSIVKKCMECISHNIVECKHGLKSDCEIDIGLGILYINIINDSVQYKFIPSKKLEDIIANAILYNEDLLQNLIENTLQEKLKNIYKEFF